MSKSDVFHLGLTKNDLQGATLAIVPGDPERVEKIAAYLPAYRHHRGYPATHQRRRRAGHHRIGTSRWRESALCADGIPGRG